MAFPWIQFSQFWEPPGKPGRFTCAEQNECGADMVCHEHVCTRYAIENESCRIEGVTVPLDTGCIGGLECSKATLTCGPLAFGSLKDGGAACGRDDVQVDECRFNASLCLASDMLACPDPPQPVGQGCDNATQCDGTSLCVDGTCQPLTTGACEKKASVQ